MPKFDYSTCFKFCQAFVVQFVALPFRVKILALDLALQVHLFGALPAFLGLLAFGAALQAEPLRGAVWPIVRQLDAADQVGHLRFDVVGQDGGLLARPLVLDAGGVAVVAAPAGRGGPHGQAAVSAAEDAGERIDFGGVAVLDARDAEERLADFLRLVERGLVDQDGMATFKDFGDSSAPPAAAVIVGAAIDQLADVERALQEIAHRVFGKGAGQVVAWDALGAEVDDRVVGQDVRVRVEHVGDFAIGWLPVGVPFESQLDRDAFDGVSHEALAVAQIGLAKVGAITRAVQIGALGTQALAVTQGNVAVPQTLAGALHLALARLLAQVVDIDLGQHPQHGEHQLAPGRGQVEAFLDRDKGDAGVVELVEDGEQAAQVA